MLVAFAGCHSFMGYRGWPFPEHDRTSFNTPSMRIDTVKQFASRSDGTDSPDQRALTDQLARQIQIETDPLVREAILQTVAEFRTPLAIQILEAGLQDESPSVRIASCKSLGQRAEARSVPSLAKALSSDSEMDVRLAAAEALGNIKSPESMAAIAVALEDRNPAMQFVGVQSMKSLTGKDYGGDVEAWRQVARGTPPPEPAVPSIAERIRSASPF
jgi:hypothetical protein